MITTSLDKEKSHLRFAIWITVLLVTYKVLIQISTNTQSTFLDSYTQLPVVQWITRLLFFWVLALLWIAYRRWCQAISRHRELQTIISSVGPDVFIVIKPDRTITLCNNATKRMFGYESSEIVGQKTGLLYFDRQAKDKKNKIYDHLERKGFHVGDATGKKRDGETFPLEIITGKLLEGPGAVILLRDITERRALEEQLRTQSISDELTNVLNRRGFFELANQQLKTARRYKQKVFLLYADVDKMKSINDALGHKEGDEALKEVATILKTTCREADIIGRLGGDEFAILGLESEEEGLKRLSLRIREKVKRSYEKENRYNLSISLGLVYSSSETPRSLDELLAEADNLMYKQKQKNHTQQKKSCPTYNVVHPLSDIILQPDESKSDNNRRITHIRN